jgi:hypothetical protein
VDLGVVIKFSVDLAKRAHGAGCLERSRIDVEAVSGIEEVLVAVPQRVSVVGEIGANEGGSAVR